MPGVLVPVDGSEASLRAVRMVTTVYRRLAPVEVTLLHVEIADGVPEDALGRPDDDRPPASAAQALVRAQSVLADAGVPYRSEVRRGYVPAAIAECAKTTGCDAIVMGTRGMGSTSEIVGSIARQVIGLSDVPVMLVK